MTPDHVSINREVWNADAGNWASLGERLWNVETPVWGNWGISENELNLIPADLNGKEAIELGCGTGYVSGWLARRGAHVTGIDVSNAQLATARRLADVHGAAISFIEGNAESTGLAESSFDFAISEYGAAIWCKPDAWLREAWRLLRPGGELVFLGNHPMLQLCTPENGAPTEYVLHRPYRGMWGVDWTKVEIDPSGVCFNLTMSDWMQLFFETGFTVTRYLELYVPEGMDEMRNHVPADWGKQYPVEQVWHLGKPA
jgi:ubiquinone/menaquinone biosynthesis C-methylase UbiE